MTRSLCTVVVVLLLALVAVVSPRRLDSISAETPPERRRLFGPFHPCSNSIIVG